MHHGIRGTPSVPPGTLYPHLTGGYKERIPSRYICKDLAVSGADAAENVVAHALLMMLEMESLKYLTIDNSSHYYQHLQHLKPPEFSIYNEGESVMVSTSEM